MKLSTRTRYGVRAMLDLAENGSKGPMQLREVARRQEISAKYLEQLMAVLKSAGLARSVRGAKGGYVLARTPERIRLSDIFHCLEGYVTTAECVENAGYCQRAADCAARNIWAKVHRAIEGVLQSVTLQDLVDQAKESGASDYQI
jgi:Rrf2 family protein